VLEVDVCLVKHDNLPGAHARTDLGSLMGIIVPGRFHQEETGKKCSQIQAEMHFGGCLLPAMLGPVKAIGHQLDCAGVNGIDGALEAARKAFIALAARTGFAAKLGMQVFQMFLDSPKQLFSHGGVPDLVGMRQSVPARRGGTAQGPQAAAVIAQRITNVIQTDGVGKLGIHQGNNMTGWAEAPRLFVNLMLPGQLGDQISRDVLEKLIDDG